MGRVLVGWMDGVGEGEGRGEHASTTLARITHPLRLTLVGSGY